MLMPPEVKTVLEFETCNTAPSVRIIWAIAERLKKQIADTMKNLNMTQ